MAATLTSMPVEVILQIFHSLSSEEDVSNLRLTCRCLGRIGIDALSTTVAFAILPESISRLRKISLHTFFEQHISSLVCIANVFWPFTSARPISSLEEYRQHRPYGSFGPEDQDDWFTYWADSSKLRAAQDEALREFEPSQAVDVVCRRFTNLKHLEVREATAPPSHFHSNQAYKNLSSKHDFEDCHELSYPGSEICVRMSSAPSVYLLSSLLRATSDSQLQSLLVDPLAVEVFGGSESDEYSQMTRTNRHLRTLKLRICVTQDPEAAKKIISRNRIRNFLCSAPDLEDLELAWKANVDRRTYHMNIAHILPRKETWSHIRRLSLSDAEFVVQVFLDFLSCHGQTLDSLELKNCALQHQGPQQCSWSNIFIPLARDFSLSKLTLEGRFILPQLPGQNQSRNQHILPHIHARDSVQDLQTPFLHVSQAIELVTCSEDFHSFLNQNESGCMDSISKIKEAIIQDLMDFDAAERVGQEHIHIPIRYVEYLRSYFSIPDDGNLSHIEWWPDPEDPDRLPFSLVPWSPSWMNTLPETWSSEDVMDWY